MNAKVIVIDDSPSVARGVASALEPLGFDVIVAHDGPTGMMSVRGTPDLALVILDFNLPGMSGLSILKWLKTERPVDPVPVIMMTTEAAPTLVQKAKDLGAKAWLVKPLQPEKLQAVALKLTRSVL
jgi:two-component system, chemotaxis family, chemotaxis protein CheY